MKTKIFHHHYFQRPILTACFFAAALCSFSPAATPSPFDLAAGLSLDSRGIWRGVDLPGGNEPLSEIWLRGTWQAPTVLTNDPKVFKVSVQGSAAVALSADDKARTADHLEGSLYMRGGIGKSFLLMGGLTWRQATAVAATAYGSGHGEIRVAGAWLLPKWTPRFSVALDLTPGQEGYYTTLGFDKDIKLGPGQLLLAMKAGYHDRTLKQRGWGSLDALGRGNALKALSDLIPSEGVLQIGYGISLPKDLRLIPHVGLSMLTAWPYFNRDPIEVWAGANLTWRASGRDQGLIPLRP